MLSDHLMHPRCTENLNSIIFLFGRLDNIFNLYCYVGSYSPSMSPVSKLVLGTIDPTSETWASNFLPFIQRRNGGVLKTLISGVTFWIDIGEQGAQSSIGIATGEK